MTDTPVPVFTFRDDSGREEVLQINHSATGVWRFTKFVKSAAAQEYSVENAETGERFAIAPGRSLMTRFSGLDSSSTEYLILEEERPFWGVRLFFEGGCTKLDGLTARLGPWRRDPAELEFSPEKRGAALARAVTTEDEALHALVQLWEHGYEIDPSGQYYVFLGGQGIDKRRADRAEVLGLISFLELEQVPVQYGGAVGEVWVRFDQRVNGEMEKTWGSSPASPPGDEDKKFVLRDGAGHEKTVWLSRAQHGHEAVRDFLKVWPTEQYSVEDPQTGASLSVDLAQSLLTRFSGSESRRTQFLRIIAPHAYRTAQHAHHAASCFVGGTLDEDAPDNLDEVNFGYWVDDLDAPQPSPEERGTARAGALHTEAEAIHEVMRIWEVCGYCDYTMNQPDGHYVFFDGEDDDDADSIEPRAVLKVLIPFLGLEQVAAPEGTSNGELWVRADPRLDAVAENYS